MCLCVCVHSAESCAVASYAELALGAGVSAPWRRHEYSSFIVPASIPDRIRFRNTRAASLRPRQLPRQVPLG